MKNFLSKKKNVNLLLGALLFVIFGQALFIGKLFSEKNNKSYEVNLVKINTQQYGKRTALVFSGKKHYRRKNFHPCSRQYFECGVPCKTEQPLQPIFDGFAE